MKVRDEKTHSVAAGNLVRYLHIGDSQGRSSCFVCCFSIHFMVGLLCIFAILADVSAGGWCGTSKKETCGAWTVEMQGYAGGISSDDCVTYTGCVDEASWVYSPGTWNQLMLIKNGFCGQGYTIDNTASFEISYDASYTNASGQRRVCIVSWAKSVDNCNWDIQNTWELYLHEQSWNETDNYESWCGRYVGSAYCSGSEYRMYDCGDNKIDGQWALRCWRQSPRSKGTTDIQCLWNWWRQKGTPNLYYYFTEVGAEQGPGTSGTFHMRGHDMVRTAKGSGGGAIDDVISVTAPDAVSPGATVTVSVTYSASMNRELHVVFQNKNDPWTTHAFAKVNVATGSNKRVDIPITIPSTTPVSAGAFKWQVFLTAEGGDFSSRLDNLEKLDISCFNPTMQILKHRGFPFRNSREVQLAIFDLSGRFVGNNLSIRPGAAAGVAMLAKGIYYVKATDGVSVKAAGYIVK